MAARKDRIATLRISLPKQLRGYVERRVRRGGFGNVSEYIRALIRQDQTTAPASPAPVPSAPMLGPPASPRPREVDESNEATGIRR